MPASETTRLERALGSVSRGLRGFASALTLDTRDSATLAAQAQASTRGSLAEQILGTQDESMKRTEDFLNAYADRAWVYACNRRIAKSMKLAPLQLKPDKPDAEAIAKHPLLDLFKNPNPQTPPGLFKATMETDLGLSGNFFAELVYGGTADSVPLQMYRMRPSKVSIVVDRTTGEILGYLFKAGGNVRPVFLMPWQVWHRRLENPLDDYYGMSPLSAARDAVSFEYQAKQQTIAYFANGMRFSGIVTGPENVDSTDMQLVRRSLNGRHQGSGNANKVLILPGEWDYVDTSGTPKDSDWLEGLALSRREVCAVYGIAPPLVSDFSEGTTYSNMGEAVNDFWQTTMVEHFQNLDEDINHSLLPRFGASAVNLVASHELKDTPAMHEDRDAAFTRSVSGYNGGVLTLNEARAEIDEDPLEYGDKRRQMINVEEIESDAPVEDDPPPPAAVPALPPGTNPDDGQPEDEKPDDPAAKPDEQEQADADLPIFGSDNASGMRFSDIEFTGRSARNTHADYPAARQARTTPIVKKSATAIAKTFAKQRDDLTRWVETAGTRAAPPAADDDQPPPPSPSSAAEIAALVRSFAWLPAESAFEQTMRSTHLLAAEQAWEHTSTLGLDVTFALDDPTVVQRLTSLRDRANGIKTIVGQQRDAVLDEVRKGMDAGASVQQIIRGGNVKQSDGSVVPIDGIKGAYAPWADRGQAWRAERVARTETGMAYSLSSVDAYRAAGITRVNVYDGTDDDDACREADGQVWTMDQAEANPLQHPNCGRAFGPAV